ncbi:hypothetical protein NQ626_18420, partial [Acinetobacter baumannii]|nr:hypothetical protein [Acinetobacter baumannii]
RSHARNWSSFEIQFALSLLTRSTSLVKNQLMSILKNNGLPLELREFSNVDNVRYLSDLEIFLNV